MIRKITLALLLATSTLSINAMSRERVVVAAQTRNVAISNFANAFKAHVRKSARTIAAALYDATQDATQDEIAEFHVTPVSIEDMVFIGKILVPGLEAKEFLLRVKSLIWLTQSGRLIHLPEVYIAITELYTAAIFAHDISSNPQPQFTLDANSQAVRVVAEITALLHRLTITGDEENNAGDHEQSHLITRGHYSLRRCGRGGGRAGAGHGRALAQQRRGAQGRGHGRTTNTSLGRVQGASAVNHN